MSQAAQVSPEEAYYVVLRTVVAGNQANWVSTLSWYSYMLGTADQVQLQGKALKHRGVLRGVLAMWSSSCRMLWAIWRSCES